MTPLSSSYKTLASAKVKSFTFTFEDIPKSNTVVDDEALILSQLPQFWCCS